jgi:predicted P-loop ATPase
METNILNNTVISYFSSIYSKEKEKDIILEDPIKIIKSDKYKSLTEEIRKTRDRGERNKLKSKLPAVTISCRVKSAHKASDVIVHSGLIQIDIDNLTDEEIKASKTKLKKDKYTFLLFDSPSGYPKLIVQIPKEIHSHKRYFEALSLYYMKEYDLKVDPACKDISRLMYLSYDPNIFINENSIIFDQISKEGNIKALKVDEKSKSDAKKIIEGIEQNKIDITKDYKDWIDVIFSLIEIFGKNANPLIHRVSRFYSSYVFEDAQKQIDSCKDSFGNGVTKNSFFHISKKHGIELVKGELIISHEKLKNKVDKFSLTESYISERYDIRNNTVSNNIESKLKSSITFEILNENDIYIELNKNGISIVINNLLAILRSSFVKKYDPFEYYFKGLTRWDGKDYIQELCTYIDVKEQNQFNYHLKKWLVRLVATAIIPKEVNKQIFVFVGQKQNSGKSTLSRFFCPPALREYLAENISLDKDSRIMMAKSILINMDELSISSGEDINSLKAFQSKEHINERLPYDRKNTVLPRRCSFIGSTNQAEFLKDETGSSRWLCFEINSINWNYSKAIDINNIYSQAYALFKSGSFSYDMKHEDIQENEIRNRAFYISTIEKDLIEKYFENDENKEPSNFYSSTQALWKSQDIEKRKFTSNNIKVGKVLTFLGFERYKYKGRYGYYLKLKS